LHPNTPSRVHELSAEEALIYRQLDPQRAPQHVAIIMDGNGRWAGKRALKRFLGHQQGAESVQFVVETASRIDLPWLTLYAFSLENNLRRPKAEVSFLMKLLKSYLVGNVKRMNDNNVRMAYIGRTRGLPAEIQDTMQWASEETARNTGTTLTLALNYGSRSEIVDSTRALVQSLIDEAHTRGCSLEDLLQVDSLEFSPLADRLRRNLRHRQAVARLPRHSPARSYPELPAARTPLRRSGRRHRRTPGRQGRRSGDSREHRRRVSEELKIIP
jgi:undecaprenyl diphosphate synthase